MVKSRSRRGAPAWPAALAAWHRRVGIGAALLAVWLAASGVLLNHTDALRLDEHHARAAWLLDWYGIESPRPNAAFRVDGHWVAQIGERIYFDGRLLRGEHGRLTGAAALGEEIAVATTERILLLTREGRLAEALGAAHGVPAGIDALGVRDGRLVARTPRGVVAAGAGMTQWRALEAGDVDWAHRAPLPESLRARLVADYRGRILTLERVLLDLHGGRLFGGLGVLLMDLAAVAFVLLAITGCSMWLTRNNGRVRHNARRK